MVKHCLFQATGYGTQFLPTAKSMLKEMMPVVNKPLIEHFDKSYEVGHQIVESAKDRLLDGVRSLIQHHRFTFDSVK